MASPPEIFNYFVIYFVKKSFVNGLFQVFHEIYECSRTEYSGETKILRKIVNYFSMAIQEIQSENRNLVLDANV